MPTISVNLNTETYVQVNTNLNPLLIQSNRDTVRITLSELQPAKSNSVYHILDGSDEPLRIDSPDTNVWALATTDRTSLIVSQTNVLAVITGQKTAFGEQSVAEITPIVQADFAYNVNDEIWNKNLNGGSATVLDHRLKLSTGASANQSATLLSRKPLKYSPGQGALVRFSAVYTAGVVGSIQFIGLGELSDGFGFGYIGADFGVIRLSYGHPEFQTLTITTASTTIENVTVTLDGIASSVPVTDSGNVTITANEIAAFDYSLVGQGWNAHSMGDEVIFENFRSVARVGAFTLVGVTVVGAFVETLAGVTATTEFTKQDDWNRDKMTTLDTTKGNIYQVRYQWLGYGPINYYVEDETTGVFTLVHSIEYANKNILPSINNPTLSLAYFVENTTNTTDVTIFSGSIGGFIEGKDVDNGIRHGATSPEKTIASGIETPVLTLHAPIIYEGVPNRVSIRLKFVIAAVDGNKSAIVRVYRNAILVGADYNPVELGSSTALFDIAATGFSGGDALFGFPLAKVASQLFPLANDKFDLRPNDFITFTVESSNSTDSIVSVNFEDLF